MPTLSDQPATIKRGSYYADSYNERWSLRHLFHKRRLDTLARLVPTPARVLDAGCGSGVLCRLLADKGCMVAGVDIHPDRVAWCKQSISEGEFSLGDLRTCNLGRLFDVVIASEVLEHVSPDDRQIALVNLLNHVTSGGRLIVTVPSALYLRFEPIWELMRGWQYGAGGHDDELRHELIDPLQMEADLKRAGCESERSGTMCWGLIRWWVARKR